MHANKNNEGEECFVEHDTQYTHILPPEQLRVDFSRSFHQQLPANELRTARRPDSLAPRTFFLERPFHLIPLPLNRPCLEQPLRITQIEQTKLKLKMANRQNLPIEQYFLKPKFKCVYNKLQTYRSDCRSFQGRLKGLDALIDYNWKCFKELEKQQQKDRGGLCSADRVDSDFESGNICRAYSSAEDEAEYYLLVESDLNTSGYNNWFFFRFRNQKKGVRRFIIANLIKKTSFFSQGMQVSVFSMKQHRYESRSWFKGGSRLTFGATNFLRQNHANDHYSSLSFEFDFPYDHDEVYFAINQPYTYSRLVDFIQTAQKRPQLTPQLMQLRTVGYSISNNIIPALRFSSSNDPKDIILVIARQHPCETAGSFIAQKLMGALLQPDPVSQFLLKQYEIVVIPMVNPDGVIHGVSRCNMAGLDLNRHWGDHIIKELTPETIKIKQFISSLTKQKRIKYMLDLHGHGKKLNSFFFCCKQNEKQNMRLLSMAMRRLQPRFDVHSCTYGISRDKENTIRSRINSMGIQHSYTLQTSLFGWKDQHGVIRHFNQHDYECIARSLLKSIFLVEAESTLTLEQLGLSKEDILGDISRFIDKISAEEEQNYDNNQILSESDPEGDKLDVKILLGNCENKALKKKLQEEFQALKRPKAKRSKKLSRVDTSKNMRQSCPSELDMKSRLSATNNSFKLKDMQPKEFQGKPQAKNKKISFTEKWLERRREIEKKKATGEKQQAEEESRNLTRMEFRSRVKTSAEPIRAKKPHLTYPAYPPSKAKPIFHHQKIKTEFKQIQDFSLVSQEEIAKNENRKSALSIKFKELRQQSENFLLTDTLSIIKFHSNDLSPDSREHKNRTTKGKKEHLMTEPTKTAPASKLNTVEEHDKDTVRYKKFKQFLNSGMSSKKMEKVSNSVFYYFPIL